MMPTTEPQESFWRRLLREYERLKREQERAEEPDPST